MQTFIVLALFGSYFYGAGKLIRWASVRSDRPVPDWWTVIGMLFWPGLLGRLSRWAMPESWGLWRVWAALTIWTVSLLLVLAVYFKLRLRYALLIWALIQVLLFLTVWEVLPMISK